MNTPVDSRRGRPRSEKARDAILAAATDLLLDRGLSAMSMDAVASAAGVSKATIYRWWPSKEVLAMDALYQRWDRATPAPDTGSLREDLTRLLSPWATLIAQHPYGRAVAGLLVEVSANPAFADEYRTRFVEHRRDQGRLILHRAIGRGEIAADVRTEVVLDLLYGSVYHRMMQGHATIDTDFVTAIVDTVLDGIRPRRGTSDG